MNINKLVEIFKSIRLKYSDPDITNQDILKMMELKMRLEAKASGR